MSSWDWDICDSDLALMTSSKSDGYFFIRANEMKISFFDLLSPLMFICDTLEEHVVFFWFLEIKHLEARDILLELYCFWEETFAYLALKFWKIVGNSYSVDILLNLAVDPIFKTVDMNKLATSLTSTRIYQRISLRRFITETYLALTF